MSAARRMRRMSPAPAVEVVRGVCDLCGERATCASINGGAATICYLCTISSAQAIARTERASKRPHDRPCTCETCVVFDEGQRGEIANLVLLERPAVRPFSNDAGDGGADPSPSPASSSAEVPRPARPHLEPCTCDECRSWARAVEPSRFSWLEAD